MSHLLRWFSTCIIIIKIFFKLPDENLLLNIISDIDFLTPFINIPFLINISEKTFDSYLIPEEVFMSLYSSKIMLFYKCSIYVRYLLQLYNSLILYPNKRNKYYCVCLLIGKLCALVYTFACQTSTYKVRHYNM